MTNLTDAMRAHLIKHYPHGDDTEGRCSTAPCGPDRAISCSSCPLTSIEELTPDDIIARYHALGVTDHEHHR